MISWFLKTCFQTGQLFVPLRPDLIKEKLGYAPSVKLADGLKVTFSWISDQIAKVGGAVQVESKLS